ncbi:unnamed protein product [Toxocara canis]|uniref:CID domain-containing protein n=1 Tax=Toxocara canis TaxID=6265 RepID=A0A183US49_TOXCA|nr:unnamed protein product [Toxocara canis]
MESEVVKAFNAELVSLYELKPPISKKKIVDITKAAMKAIKFYKHIVFCVEKFLIKCKADYKIPGLYCIDSIIRQSRHQFKDKDVFGPRFAINMAATLSNLLNCKSDDKPKVVRVLNLWRSHGVFDEAQVKPWLDYCREQHSLETDCMQVEKAVKGDQADMSIYNRVPAKVDKKKIAEPQTPPPLSKTEFRARTPPLPIREPSDECVDGGVSERETLAMLKTMGLDLGGMFSSDHALLQKMHKLVNDKLIQRREIDSKRQGNIKSLLSREFDYSDEEESGDEDGGRKLQIDVRPNELTKQQIMGMAEAVLREPDTKEEIQRLHTERLSALTQAAAARVQVARQNAATIAAVAAVANAPRPPLASATPINIPLNAAAHPVAPASGGIALPPGMIPSPAQHVMPSGPPPTAPNIAAFTPTMPPPNFVGIPPPQPGAQPSIASNLALQGQNRMDVDQDDRVRRHEEKYERDRDDRERRDRDRERRDERRRERSRDRDRERDRSREKDRERDRDREREFGENRGYGERSSKRSRRSRSRERERSGETRREHRGNVADERRGSSRGRDRERDAGYREIERQRRKMGIPWPPKDEHVIIASCTLWFGRLPANCSEDDIRLSMMEAGEPSRITIINSRACAYVTMKDRKSAFRAIDRLQKNIQVAKKSVKLNWATGQGLKGDKYAAFWDAVHGISQIPYNMLPEDLEPLLEGGHLDVETLPPNLASLYDEHGIKGKKKDEHSRSATNAPSEVQMPPAAASLPPFPFSVNQPPQLGGMPPFFAPGMMPMPGAFPAGLPPPVGTVPPSATPSASAQQASNKSANSTSVAPASASNAPPTAALAPQQMIAMTGMRMPAFDANGVPGAAPLLPPNFGNPPPARFPGGPSPFPGGVPGFRGSRPGFPGRGGFDGAFRGRPPFPVPPNMQQMLGAPPPGFMPPGGMPPRGMRPFGAPPVMQTMTKPEETHDGGEKRKRSEEDDSFGKKTKWGDENVGRTEGGRETRRSNWVGNEEDHSEQQPNSVNSSNLTAIKVVDHEQTNSASEPAVSSRAIDDAGEEHVTSTTHDDDNSEEPAAVIEVNGDGHQNDDLKAVTRTEDEILENAIIYSHEDEE